MATKTTADKPKSARSRKKAEPAAAAPNGTGTAVKQDNIANASFAVPAEAFTVELPEDPGAKRKRHSFAKILDVLELPDLIELQKASFKWFINDGLKDAFESISPIKDFTGNLVLEFGDHSLGEPKYSVEECRERDMTYSAPLRVRVRLITAESGEIKGIPDQEIFMGDFPLMTDKGTFMINGAERVIVSQLVRSHVQRDDHPQPRCVDRVRDRQRYEERRDRGNDRCADRQEPQDLRDDVRARPFTPRPRPQLGIG